MNKSILCKMTSKKMVIKMIVAFLSLIIVFTLSASDKHKLLSGAKSFLNTNKKVEMIGMNDVQKIGDNRYLSVGNDPFVAYSIPETREIKLEIDLDKVSESAGRVYYACSDQIFAEEKSFDFVYKNGTNIITLNSGDVNYIRFDVTDSPGTTFEIKKLENNSSIVNAFSDINMLFLVLVTLLLIVFFFLASIYLKKSKLLVQSLIGMITVLFALYSKFVFSNGIFMYMDIGSDTFVQYYPHFLGAAINVKEGLLSSWYWNFGLGSSLLSILGWVTDPFNFVSVMLGAVGNLEWIDNSLIWMQIIKVMLVFFFSYKYISLFVKNKTSICVSAGLCAISGYIMLWGQHYVFGTAMVYVSILVYLTELYIRKNKFKYQILIVLAIAGLEFYTFYQLYMILLFLAGYYLLRYFSVKNNLSVKKIIVDLMGYAIPVILGMCISGITFIPRVYNILTQSSRINGQVDGIFTKIINAVNESINMETFGTRMSRLMSNNSIYINDTSKLPISNYYELPQLVVSLFIFYFVGIAIWYFLIKKTGKKRIVACISLVVGFVFVFCKATGLIFNAFVAPAYRYTFVIIPVLAVVVAKALEVIITEKKIHIFGIIFGFIGSLFAWCFSFAYCSNEVKYYVVLIGIGLLAGTVLLLVIRRAKAKKIFVSLFIILVCITSFADAYITTNQRVMRYADNNVKIEDDKINTDSAKAVRWLKKYDSSFYRIEKTNIDWNPYSDNIFEGYSNLTWYNSTETPQIQEFYNKIYKESVAVDTAHRMFVIGTDLSVEAISLAGVKYILSNTPLNYEWCKEINKIGNVYIYQNTNMKSVARLYSKEISKEDFEKESDLQKALILKDSIVVENKENKNLTQTDGEVKNLKLGEDTNELLCEVKSSADSVLMAPITYREGWEVYVDGEKTECKKVDYAFIGVPISAGTHHIKFVYSIPKFGMGIAVSCIGICLFAIFCFVNFWKNKKQQRDI